MEYQILLEMIDDLVKEAESNLNMPVREFDRYTDQIRILAVLRNRIDKQRESDIIAMSNEGCI